MSYEWHSSLVNFTVFISVFLLMIASLHDVVARAVPNRLAAALAGSSMLGSALQGRLLSGVAAGAIVFGFALFCWKRGWMGGADVKLLAAAAIAVSPAMVPIYLCAVSLAGGLLALVYLFGRLLVAKPAVPRQVPRSLSWLARVLRIERWRISRGGPLPYACAIAAGSAFILL